MYFYLALSTYLQIFLMFVAFLNFFIRFLSIEDLSKAPAKNNIQQFFTSSLVCGCLFEMLYNFQFFWECFTTFMTDLVVMLNVYFYMIWGEKMLGIYSSLIHLSKCLVSVGLSVFLFLAKSGVSGFSVSVNLSWILDVSLLNVIRIGQISLPPLCNIRLKDTKYIASHTKLWVLLPKPSK